MAARFPDGKLDVIKLDLEGAEQRALAGPQHTLRQARRLILFEAQRGSIGAVSALFAEAGYGLLCLDPTAGHPVPFGRGAASDNLVAVHRDRDWGLLIR